MIERWARELGIATMLSFLIFVAYKEFIPQRNSAIIAPSLHALPVPETLILLIYGLFFGLMGWLYTSRAWSMTAEEYNTWLFTFLGRFKRGAKATSSLKNTYLRSKDRFISPLMLLVGGLATLYGSYSLLVNLFVALGLVK